MKKIEDYKKLGYDFIGDIAVDLDIDNNLAIIQKTIDMFDCNGELEGSIIQELAETLDENNQVRYHAIANILQGRMTEGLGVELLGASAYEFNEYVHV